MNEGMNALIEIEDDEKSDFIQQLHLLQMNDTNVANQVWLCVIFILRKPLVLLLMTMKNENLDLFIQSLGLDDIQELKDAIGNNNPQKSTTQKIFNAIQNGNLHLLKLLPNKRIQNSTGHSLLYVSAKFNQIQIVHYLAILFKNQNLINFIGYLKYSEDMKHISKENLEEIQAFCQNFQYEMAFLALSKLLDCKPGTNIGLGFQNDEDLMKVILSEDILKVTLNSTLPRTNHCLQNAAQKGELLLLYFSKNKEWTNERGESLIHIGARNGQKEVVKYLITKVNVNLKTTLGETPLWLASENGYTSIVEILLKHGANVNTTNNLHVSPLYVATERGNIETVKILLQSGADPNIKDYSSKGRTPLDEANFQVWNNGGTSHNHTKIIEILEFYQKEQRSKSMVL